MAVTSGGAAAVEELGELTAKGAAQGSLGLGPWDVAAGALLITEAGGTATDWQGDAAGL